MDIFETRYFKINKLALSFIGQWCYQGGLTKRTARTLIFLSLTTPLIPQFFFLASVRNDLDAALECLPAIFIPILCFCQMCVFLSKEKKLLKLLHYIQSDWKFWSSGPEFEILSQHAEKGRFFTLLYAVNVYTGMMTFIIMSLTPIVLDIIIPLNETRPRQQVYDAIYPFNHDKNFHWILIYGAVTVFYNLSILFSCEALLAVTTQHVCGIFSIICYRLQNTMELIESKQKIQGKIPKDEIYKEMSLAVECHNNALEYASILEAFYSPFLFVTIGINVIILSVLGIQTLNTIGSPEKTIKFGAFTLSVLVHFYCITLPPQNLLDCSGAVSFQAYNVPWYHMSLKSKKLLLMIIMRSQEPCKLTAGKFYTMDMETFSALLKTSVSFFTVLSSMR
ncbi:odorant receptor 13a-like isoform X1 [Belonocnema kinseyi]|uniref:odorant receptor 13a-like isoform X1 n=1 Tax=Belonocnema kinseyi TaxID=2817044 RepID=UPI00143DF7B6|nr:odorant receptor 13a-like isoform X1 [Belonocnema kinseyi]